MRAIRTRSITQGENGIRAEDEDLGPVRYCTECREWWPDDEEFFEPGVAGCRACTAERVERRRQSLAQAARRYRQRQQPRSAPV